MRWYEWVSIAAVGTTALLCSTLLMVYLPCRCCMMTEAEQHAVWRASMLSAHMAYDWEVRDSPDREHMVGYYSQMSDTLYDLLRKRGRIGSLRSEPPEVK
jgi:uncharacterized protein (DUF2236 family)